MSPIEEYPELEDNFMSEERELQEDGEEKEEELPENVNTEMISMQTLLQVFRGGNEVLDANRFASHQRIENIYLEVGWVLSLKGQPKKITQENLRQFWVYGYRISPEMSQHVEIMMIPLGNKIIFSSIRIIDLINLFFFLFKNFIKVFQDLGSKNLEPVEVAVLLKHPFIQDLILCYPDYKIPVSITQRS